MRPIREVLADPRRLGGWDHFAVVDMRIEGSALAAWRAHVASEDDVRGLPQSGRGASREA